MKLNRPYNRIIRPLSLPDGYAYGYSEEETYLADNRYANDRYEVIRAYHILQKDLIELFEYVEPSDGNLNAFSHRIYELLLRASTEFEMNAKKILVANNYSRAGSWNITDYYKINSATKLSEYRLFINIWGNGRKEIMPFHEWSQGHSLSWYADYNSVKHNRHDMFHKASLENLLLAVGAVFSIVFAQFHMFIFSPLHPPMGYHISDAREISSKDTLFSIILPDTWTEEETYDFDWRTLRTVATPFQSFNF